jgi:hypothetical protein
LSANARGPGTFGLCFGDIKLLSYMVCNTKINTDQKFILLDQNKKFHYNPKNGLENGRSEE